MSGADDTLAADDLAQTIMAVATDATPQTGSFATGAERYREVRLIGRGGMGRVVEVEDLQFGRRVALKTMLEGQARAQRFGLEAVVTANLDHPGIPAVYERGQDHAGNPFYVMRLIRGRSLDQAIAETRTLDDRLRLLPALIDVAQTLAFAHARGVIHRDIKPDNVVVGAFGDTVVIDWGLAKLRRLPHDAAQPVSESELGRLAADEQGGTRDGAIVGTPAYMPPEQAAGRTAEIDERSDVFSIGALLYHLFAGRPPYRGNTSLATLTQALEAEYEPLSRVAPEVPGPLVAIVDRAMAKDPAQRYASAGALADALQAVVAAGIGARGSKAVRLFANATSAVLTLVMVIVALGILVTVPIANLGFFGVFIVPTFVIGAVLASIEWWTVGRYALSPLVLALAIVTALEGLVGASVGRAEVASVLSLASEQGASAGELAAQWFGVAPIVELAETVGLQLCAALLVLYAVARYRIGTTPR